MPDRARPSLEAWGFDLVRTASELLGLTMCWSDNLVLPPLLYLHQRSLHP